MADDINPRTATLARRLNSTADRPALRQAGVSVQEARQMMRSPEGQARLERIFSGGEAPQTRTGGAGGGGGRPPVATAQSQPPSPRGGSDVAPREGRAVTRPSTVIDGDPPRQPRFVPNTYQDPALPGPQSRGALPAPDAPAPPAGGSMAGRLARGAGRMLGPASVAVDLAMSPEANPRGEREAVDAMRSPSATAARDAAIRAAQNPTGAAGMRSERAEEATNPNAPASPDGVTYRPRARVRGSVGRPQASEADALNAAMLRNLGVNEDTQGRALPVSPSREEQVKRLIRRSEEGYRTGGIVKKRDGLAIKGRTKGRFC